MKTPKKAETAPSLRVGTPALQKDHPYASRGGLKLEGALKAFGIDPTGQSAADLGCSTGGFVSCWLHFGAAKVFAVDTAYGELAWSLRKDPRVVVMERSNALHTAPHAGALAEGGVDFVSLDLGWTRQEKALPAALTWLKPGGSIITLVKPHYEKPVEVSTKRRGKKEVATLSDDEAETISRECLSRVLPALGLVELGCIPCPIKGEKGGNLEFLVWVKRA